MEPSITVVVAAVAYLGLAAWVGLGPHHMYSCNCIVMFATRLLVANVRCACMCLYCMMFTEHVHVVHNTVPSAHHTIECSE